MTLIGCNAAFSVINLATSDSNWVSPAPAVGNFMQDISVSTLIDMTIGLARGDNDQDRFNNLLDAIRKSIQCDSVALLSRQGDTLVPLALQGLTRDTLGRRFKIDEHPRFARICESKTAVRFDADSDLPDPFDNLLLDYEGDLPMHSCMGLPLLYADKLLGVLTLDSLTPGVFEQFPTRSLDALSGYCGFYTKSRAHGKPTRTTSKTKLNNALKNLMRTLGIVMEGISLVTASRCKL